MTRFKALLRKDVLLLLRDKAGLSLMFLMPALLVAIMTWLQDSTFRVALETQVPLLLLNEDRDSLGAAVEQQIRASGIFTVSEEVDGKRPSREELISAVERGDYMMGIIIPENATRNIRRNVKRYVAATMSGGSAPLRTDSVRLNIYLDPVTKPSFRQTLMSALREYAVRTESDLLFKEMTAEVARRLPDAKPPQLAHNSVRISEQYAQSSENTVIPNAVQHNVPAWSVFAIFFIALSLSGGVIREREEGSFNRLLTMPCPYSLYLSAKATVYLLVCLAQLALILAMGVWLFPVLGLPALALPSHWGALLLNAVCTALAAIGYGVAIGALSGTDQQAAVFSSVSVVIMAAVGGVWIPVFAMPAVMQMFSRLSPLNWGLEGFYDVIFRNGGVAAVLPECAISIAFAAACIVVAVAFRNRKNR
jgi:ABC-2 type transport system permease protein